MEKLFVISAILLTSSPVMDAQKLQHAHRFRNFSVESETASAYMINMTIFQYEMEHRISADINVTKDVDAKAIHVVLERCSFEKSECEYFQTWKFNYNLNGIVYMKNQMWTPIFQSITPHLDIPAVKKNIYRSRNATMNTDAIMTFYPDNVKYYWKADAILVDANNKKAVVLKFEFAIFEYAQRNRKPKPK